MEILEPLKQILITIRGASVRIALAASGGGGV